MTKFATILSYLFHPLLMATYGCLFVFFGLSHSLFALYTPLKIKWVITLLVFSFTFCLPVLNMLLLLKLKQISSLHLEKKEERVIPMLLTVVAYFALYYLLKDFNIWPTIKLLVLGAGIAILIAALITKWWQISAHLIGIGGILGMLFAFSFYLQMPVFMALSAIIVIAGFVGFARLKLQAHTQSQVYIGLLVGCIVQFCLFGLAQYINFV